MSDMKLESGMDVDVERMEIERTLLLLQDIVTDPMSSRQKRAPPPEQDVHVICSRAILGAEETSSLFDADVVARVTEGGFEEIDDVKVYASHYCTVYTTPCTTRIVEITDAMRKNQIHLLTNPSTEIHSSCKLQVLVNTTDLVTVLVESLCLRAFQQVNQPYDLTSLTVPAKKPKTVTELIDTFSLPYYTPIILTLQAKFPKQYRMFDSCLRLFLGMFSPPSAALSKTVTMETMAEWVEDNHDEFLTSLPVAGAMVQLLKDYTSLQSARVMNDSDLLRICLYIEYKDAFVDPVIAQFQQNVKDATPDAFVWDDNYDTNVASDETTLE